MAKFEVKICYSGFVVEEVEAENETEAYDRVQEELAERGFDDFSEKERESFLDTLERRDEADQINQIE
jgi:hypothetical protein